MRWEMTSCSLHILFQHGSKLAPGSSFLPWNLGLITSIPVCQNKYSYRTASIHVTDIFHSIWHILRLMLSSGSMNVALVWIPRNMTCTDMSVWLHFSIVQRCCHPVFNTALSVVEQAMTEAVIHFSLSQEMLSVVCVWLQPETKRATWGLVHSCFTRLKLGVACNQWGNGGDLCWEPAAECLHV